MAIHVKTIKTNETGKAVFKSRVPFQVEVTRLDAPLEGRKYKIEAPDGETFEGELDAQGKTELIKIVEGEAVFFLLPPEEVSSAEGDEGGDDVEIETAAPPAAAQDDDDATEAPPEVTIVHPDDDGAPCSGVLVGGEARFKALLEPSDAKNPEFSWSCSDGSVELVDAGAQVVTVKGVSLPGDPGQPLSLSCKVTTQGGEDEATHEFLVVDVRLHLDADRDGEIDEDTEGLDVWEWGEGKKGAIVLCNADDEGSDGEPDCASASTDGPEDMSDLLQLDIRRPDGEFPDGWFATLVVSNPDGLRVFSQPSPGAVEIIGPNMGDKHTFQDMSESPIELALEGLKFPHKDFPNGEATLTLEISDDKGRKVGERKAVVRVAPWLMLHHLQASERVYVMAVDLERAENGNREFRDDLNAGLRRAGLPPAEEADYQRYGGDRWLQDAMEIGFTAAPGQDPLPVALRTANDRGPMFGGTIDRFPKQELLGPDYGWTQALPPVQGGTMDSFGNLELSPPVEVDGQKYPFGRIVYGRGSSRSMRAEMTDFLTAQKLQAPFPVDTGWLQVGHVDEFLTFLPCPRGRFGFKLGLASSRLAVQILRDLSGRGQGGVWMLEDQVGDYAEVQSGDTAEGLLERYKQTLDPTDYWTRSKQGLKTQDLLKMNPMFDRIEEAPCAAGDRIGASERNLNWIFPGEKLRLFLNPDHPEFKWLTPDQLLADTKMLQVQEFVQGKIDACLETILAGLGLEADDVVELPSLFMPQGYQKYIAYTPGMVNMLVVTRAGSYASTVTNEPLSTDAVCCVPKPFGPVVSGQCQFELEAERRLSALGLDVQFVDDLFSYHVLQGEVHCGTNTLRALPTRETWWTVEGLA